MSKQGFIQYNTSQWPFAQLAQANNKAKYQDSAFLTLLGETTGDCSLHKGVITRKAGLDVCRSWNIMHKELICPSILYFS